MSNVQCCKSCTCARNWIFKVLDYANVTTSLIGIVVHNNGNQRKLNSIIISGNWSDSFALVTNIVGILHCLSA